MLPVFRPMRRFFFIALIIFFSLGAVPACSKSHPKAKKSPTPSASPSPSKPPEPQADFRASGVAPVDAQDRASAFGAANDAAKKVIDLVNTYYDIAFLQPSRWGGGQHPDLGTLFSDDAKGSLAGNLQVVALGSVAAQLSKVTPVNEQAGTIRVLIEPNGGASYAAVPTHFDATGTAVSGGGAVPITHDAQLLVDIAAGKIIGYDMGSRIGGSASGASYVPKSSEALAALAGGPA